MKLADNLPKIKKGQLWKKKSTGVLWTITAGKSGGKEMFRMSKMGARGNTHHITSKDIYLWFILQE